MLPAVSDAVAAGKEHGMVAFVETWESSIGEKFPEPGRTWMLELLQDRVDVSAREGIAG